MGTFSLVNSIKATTMKSKFLVVLALSVFVSVCYSHEIAAPASTNQIRRMARALKMAHTNMQDRPAICGFLDHVSDFLPSCTLVDAWLTTKINFAEHLGADAIPASLTDPTKETPQETDIRDMADRLMIEEGNLIP